MSLKGDLKSAAEKKLIHCLLWIGYCGLARGPLSRNRHLKHVIFLIEIGLNAAVENPEFVLA